MHDLIEHMLAVSKSLNDKSTLFEHSHDAFVSKLRMNVSKLPKSQILTHANFIKKPSVRKRLTFTWHDEEKFSVLFQYPSHFV